MSVNPVNDTATYANSAGQAQEAQGVAIVYAPGLSTRTVPSTVTTDTGTTLAANGTAAVAFTNTALVEVINPATTDIWARWNAAPAANGAGSFPIAAKGSFARDRVAGVLNLLNTAASAINFTVNRYVPA